MNTSHVEQSQEPDGLRSSHSRNPSLHLLLNRTFHRRIHKSWLLNQIWTQNDSVSIFIHSKIHFNIILLFTPWSWSFKWPFPLSFSSKILVTFLTCFMPATFNSLGLLLKTILLRSHILNLFILFGLSSLYFLPFMPASFSWTPVMNTRNGSYLFHVV